jgi:8-oxo-dGTP pyrophosphatase MutT (NUDIX family)
VVLERKAARTFVVADESVLLIRACDPAHPEHGTWWMTPGGGVDDGEETAAAAARELREETGLERTPEQMGAVVATRIAEFDFADIAHRQTEWFYAVRIERFTPEIDGWDALEQDALLELRWWTVPELLASDDRFYPVETAAVVQAIIDDCVDAPIELSGH